MNNILDIDIENKKVLMRADYNVPIESGSVLNNFRIVKSIPTIKYCLDRKASVVLMSHLGRPLSKDESFSLKPVANELSSLLNLDVKISDSCISEESINISNNLEPGEIHLLENLRFHKGEKQNDINFSRELSRHGDIYINDAFGTAHRSHASNVGIVSFMDESSICLLYTSDATDE